MIIVSGWRAGLVIGLIVTPLKIQHEQSRWNKKFGSGGRSMLVGSAVRHISPASSLTSALVIPPIRNSATCTASPVRSCGACRTCTPLRPRGYADTPASALGRDTKATLLNISTLTFDQAI